MRQQTHGVQDSFFCKSSYCQRVFTAFSRRQKQVVLSFFFLSFRRISSRKKLPSFVTWKAGFLMHTFKHFKEEAQSLVAPNCHYKMLRPQQTCHDATLLPQPTPSNHWRAYSSTGTAKWIPQRAHHLLRGTEPLQLCLTRFFITKLLFDFLPHESFYPGRLTGPDWRCNINFSRTGELQ